MKQVDNLIEYFLKFLPSKKIPSKSQENCQVSEKYQKIAEALEDSIVLAFMSFCAFIALDF